MLGLLSTLESEESEKFEKSGCLAAGYVIDQDKGSPFQLVTTPMWALPK